MISAHNEAHVRPHSHPALSGDAQACARWRVLEEVTAMPITLKTAAALFAIFVTLFIGASVILENSVEPGFQRLENTAHARDGARIQAFLETSARDLEARAVDYAHWDDTYDFFGGSRPSFLVDNFPDEWFANYGIDMLAFADERGRILWTRSLEDDGNLTSNPDATQAILADARRGVPRAQGLSEGVAWSQTGPYLYAAARATPTSGAGAQRGYVILAKRISRQSLRNQVQLDLSLVHASDAPSDLRARMANLTTSAATWTENNITRSMVGLRSADGEVTGAVLEERPSELAKLGTRSMDLALALFALMSALGLVALWILLREIVISRIVRLQHHLEAQSNALTPYAAKPSSDEIGRLTDAYNGLVERLHDSAQREHQANLEREAAAAANRMKSDFLANLSHQLRTPLDSIIGYAELVEEELEEAGVEVAGTDIQNVRFSARHLLSVVNEILDLAKIEAGRLEITPQAFVIDEMLFAAVETAKPLARENGATFELKVEGDLGVAVTDEQRLRQCLFNVIAHACTTAKGGHVTLTAARDADALRFEVHDTGPPMSEVEISRAFEPFAQVQGGRHRHGADLGLAVTGKLMTLIRGRIGVRSSESEGTTFFLLVPANLEEQRQAA
jgi:signal transduction histidine kinase